MSRNGRQATVVINGRDVLIEWTEAAANELATRSSPLVVEVQLYFSCLVKKFVHFHEEAREREVAVVNGNLSVFFRPVMSTPCSFEEADRLGRQPEADVPGDAVKKIAPQRVRIDRKQGAWKGEVWF